MTEKIVLDEDTLNDILVDVVADQVLLALDAGFSEQDVRDGMERALDHGIYEYENKGERRKGWKKDAMGRRVAEAQGNC